MPNCKHTPTHSTLTLPSISGVQRFIHTVTRSSWGDQRYTVFSCALPFFMTLSCQCYRLQTRTPAHTQQLTLLPTHTHMHMHTNESHRGNYRAEPFMLAGYQMLSSPLTTVSVLLARLLPSRLCVHTQTQTLQFSFSNCCCLEVGMFFRCP